MDATLNNVSWPDALLYAGLLLVAGPAVIEVAGYVWHRFVEHHGWFGRAFKHRHWVHHEVKYPITCLRSAIYHNAKSWSWYVLLGGAFCLEFLLLPWPMALAMALGGLAYGSLVILLFHAAFHVNGHLLWRYKWFRRLVRRHDIHHWTRANYGILFFGLDRLFGTLRDDFPAEKQEIF